MSGTAEMDRYKEVGKRNLEAMRLVGNWCAHAKIVEEGVGMIAVQLQLPVGHFSMACDHAPFHGMAAWEFSEVALDFYDHACVSCPHRKPVSLPNLSRLVAEREAAAKQAELAAQAAALETAAQLSARQAARTACAPASRRARPTSSISWTASIWTGPMRAWRRWPRRRAWRRK